MLFTDLLTLDARRRTRDGYLAARAKAARAGIYDYLGREIDPQATKFQADEIVKVYRPPEEVFAKDSVASFLMKPVTNDHPTHPVTADNWRQHSRGVVGKALREGDYLSFDIVIMDADLIKDVESGKRELSNGYASDISFEDGTTKDGQIYQAIQRNIRGNHVAVVDKGRAGPFCRIQDAAPCEAMAAELVLDWLTNEETYSADNFGDKNASDATPRGSRIPSGEGALSQDGDRQVTTKTILVDGLNVEVTDAAERAILKLQGQLADATTAKGALETKVGELTAAVATKDGEIAGLNQKLKDAEVGPEKLQQMAADRATLIEKAKAIDPKVVTDGKTDAEIRRAVVVARLGDSAPSDDNGIAGAFTALSKDTKPVDPVRKVLADGAVSSLTDGAGIVSAVRAARYQ